MLQCIMQKWPHLNTSYVDIKHMMTIMSLTRLMYLNTSYVDIKHEEHKHDIYTHEFKYILC